MTPRCGREALVFRFREERLATGGTSHNLPVQDFSAGASYVPTRAACGRRDSRIFSKTVRRNSKQWVSDAFPASIEMGRHPGGARSRVGSTTLTSGRFSR